MRVFNPSLRGRRGTTERSGGGGGGGDDPFGRKTNVQYLCAGNCVNNGGRRIGRGGEGGGGGGGGGRESLINQWQSTIRILITRCKMALGRWPSVVISVVISLDGSVVKPPIRPY